MTKNTPDARPETSDYSATAGFATQLEGLGCALAFTSYASNLLYLLSADPDGGLHIHQTRIERPMGLRRGEPGTFLLGAGAQIIHFADALTPGETANDIYRACFVPRRIDLTGPLDAHDVGYGEDGRPLFVATRFNCIATTDRRHGFAPVWRPPFISALVDEDRCHLNGLAMDGSRPAFATAVSRSDTIDGWRDRRADGGVAIDIGTGEIVCEGLSMPHSPRMHRGDLWLLNAGSGELGRVIRDRNGAPGRFEPLCFCPGFLRGLSFAGDFAFVGLSKPRYQRFEGLALEDRLRRTDSEPWCGIQVIDLRTGRCAQWFRIDGAMGEIYDVELLPDVRMPMALSPTSPELGKMATWSGI